MKATAGSGFAARWAPTVLLGGILFYLVAVPLIVLLVSSVKPTGLPLDQGWTLSNYARTYSDPKFYELVWTTFRFAVGASLLALSIGVLMAWLVERTDLPAKGLVRVMVILPMATPPLLLAIGWIMLLSPRTGFINDVLVGTLGLEGAPFDIFSLSGMIFVEALSLVPSTFLILSPAFRNMDPNLEEAAVTSGAGFWLMLRRIVLPLLLPAILAAGAFLMIVGFVVFDIPGIIGMPVGIFVLASHIVYLAHDAAGGMSQYGLISAIAVFFLAILFLLAWTYQRATRQAGRFVTVTGKNFRPRPFQLKGWRWPAFGIVVVYFMLATVAPIGILTWASLMPFYASPSWEMLQNVTLANHEAFFSNRRAVQAAQNSVIIAVVASTLVALLSVLISWTVVRSKAAGKKFIDILSFMPIAIPGVMIGVALIYVYLVFSWTGIYGSVWIIVIAYLTTYISFGSRATHGVMTQLHPDLEDAARTSGAGWLRSMWRVIVPLTLPAILAVWIWVLAHCMRELSSALLLQGNNNRTVPVLLYNYWSGGQPNRAAAVGVWLVVAMLVVVSLWQFLVSRSRVGGAKG
ncbi:MAG: iron ABC transporter permease [Rhizobiaceae bacterium]|nr:iron ABC transporter permease [Rhizobiaceae bacterium]MCV0407258.1 iron ABC transporter permease [Rhizobiaceae bacterium]